MNPSTALATTLVDELARHGLTDAVLAPGSRSAPLAYAFHADERVRLHVRLDERSAGFLALGLAKGSGRPAAVVTTSGTATANLHPAIMEADQARVPLLVLTADRPPELRGAGANQTADQIGLYGRAPRWFCEVGAPEPLPAANAYWRSTASRAWAAATGATGPAGPVHLNLALRDPLVPGTASTDDGWPHAIDGRPSGAPWTATAAGGRPPTARDVDWLAEQVSAAERGLLVIGETPAEPEPLLALAEAAGWPVVAEPQSGARSGPHAITTADLLLRHEQFVAAHRPDLVVTVGRAVLSKHVLAILDPATPHVLVDADGAWIDPQRTVSRLLVADPALLAAAVAEDILAREGSEWLDAWRLAEARARAAIDEVLDGTEAPTEPRTARDLAALAPAGAVLVVGSSMPVRDLNTFMRARDRLRVVGNRGVSGIDGFVSTAVGVALAHQGPTVALTGDLSLLHDSNGLLVGDDRPDLVLVVVNNDGGGIFSFLPQAEHRDQFETLFGTPHGVDLARVAAVAGWSHTLLEHAADLGPAGEAAQRTGGIAIIEVRTDRTENRILHTSLAHAAHAAIQ